VLQRIAQAWKQDRDKISEQGTRIIAALAEATSSHRGDDVQLSADTLEAGFREIARSYDEHEGGFGRAPKFPRPVTLNFMFRVYARHRGGAMAGARSR
jgi:uncharacterized protein YyaL (SSP411 family)